MAKVKTQYVCQNCGANSAKWIGKCPSCNEWNTYVEEVIAVLKTNLTTLKPLTTSATLISEIKHLQEERIDTLSSEFNRVLGGGLVPGSLVLIGGEPGIGKSTLALQIALNLDKKTLYISGEESLQQIKMRAERINNNPKNCYVLSEVSIETIINQIEHENPDIVVIDSVQTLQTERVESSPGSVTQIRESTALLMRIAKEKAIPFIIIGHINKDGNIAGPKVLEHMVDTVLQFEGDRNHIYRILRATKNRFGSTSELGIFEMQGSGLREVNNPSELLMSQSDEDLSGVSIAACVDGIRPFLIEVQALVSSSAYGTPQRTSTGFDLRRLSMLLAVLEKRAGFRLGQKDVFLNIAGGIRVDDPAIDLSVICSVLSSDQDISIKKDICFAGEVGLSGEIRPVNRVEQRISEAQKLGFNQIYISKYNQKGVNFSKFNIKINFVGKVEQVFRSVFA